MSNDPVSQMREYMLERLLTDKELREINRTLTHGTQILYDHIATLKAELDAARRDTARLDWLQRENNREDFVAKVGVKVKNSRDDIDWHDVSGDLRAKIDWAMDHEEAA